MDRRRTPTRALLELANVEFGARPDGGKTGAVRLAMQSDARLLSLSGADDTGADSSFDDMPRRRDHRSLEAINRCASSMLSGGLKW